MKVFIVFAALLAGASAGTKPLEGRIIGGELAQQGEFPYQVGLSISDASGSSAWCGGSLISDQWVLTAAHCTYRMNKVVVNLGSTRRLDPKQLITSTEFYIHEKYNPYYSTNDISLVKLPYKATITEFVKPVALPKLSNKYSNYVGSTVIASGWGKTSDDVNVASEYLYYVYRTVNPNSDCTRVYGTPAMQDSNICVGTKDGDSNKSTCNGDSGGPLVLSDGTHTQIGLTSYGAAAGCDKGYPVVFTRLTSYLDWIKTISGVYS